jgi:outer membrane protein OmpA-like peptidoglycan-associated protein
MKSDVGNSRVLIQFGICAVLLAGLSAANAQQMFEAGKKAKVTGTIQSRNGDLVTVTEKKSGDKAVIDLTDFTKIERKKDFRLRRTDMDMTALVPGLTIDVEGEGNSAGQLEAKKIEFDPDVFSIEVAEEKQIQANQAAASRAQSTANQGAVAAGQAQSSANVAQASANNAQTTADAAGQTAVMVGAVAAQNADSVQLVNQRVSDLADYKTVGEAQVFFKSGGTTLSDDDKAALSKLAKDAMAIQNYMIEVAGYASSTGTKTENLNLSDERAEAVADYLRNSANVPMRRILLPAGYGATHPEISNQSAEGRDINQRVDVKVIVNKGIEEGVAM